MAKFTGTVRSNSLEGGFFELECDDGKVYRLDGDISFSPGDRVRVHGTVASGGFGIHMSGPSLTVERIESE